jgi:hypothetical protein
MRARQWLCHEKAVQRVDAMPCRLPQGPQWQLLQSGKAGRPAAKRAQHLFGNVGVHCQLALGREDACDALETFTVGQG